MCVRCVRARNVKMHFNQATTQQLASHAIPHKLKKEREKKKIQTERPEKNTYMRHSYPRPYGYEIAGPVDGGGQCIEEIARINYY